MHGRELDGMRVAILVTDRFEQVELTEPRKALDAAGAVTRVVAPHGGTVRGMHHARNGEGVAVDVALGEVEEVSPEEFDAVLLPGGVMNADALRVDPKAQEFVRRMNAAGKPIAVVGHAPWLLVSAGVMEGRVLTSAPSLHDDLRNAGARWEDAPVVRDRNWVSARGPGDLPLFTRAMVELFAAWLRRHEKAA
jgi:protease I